MMGKQHFAVAAIGAVCAASSVQAQDITITNLVDPQAEMTACLNALSGESFADEMCTRSLAYLNDLTPKIENAHYDLLLELNTNTDKANQKKANWDYGPAGDTSMIYLIGGVRLKLENLSSFDIKHSILGRDFVFDGREHDNKYRQHLAVYETIRSTYKYDGQIISDFLFKTRKNLSDRYDCSQSTDYQKCLLSLEETHQKYRTQNQTKGFYTWNAFVDKNINVTRRIWMTDEAFVKEYAAKYLSVPSAIFEDRLWQFSTMNLTKARNGGYRWGKDERLQVSLVGQHETPKTDAFAFRRIEGGRARLKMAQLDIWEEPVDEKPTYVADSRYAGDVQRCIVEVRNSMRADRTTGSVLSGLASVLGAGNVSRAISTANNASSTWDSLTGAERSKVDACMKRKGHD